MARNDDNEESELDLKDNLVQIPLKRYIKLKEKADKSGWLNIVREDSISIVRDWYLPDNDQFKEVSVLIHVNNELANKLNEIKAEVFNLKAVAENNRERLSKHFWGRWLMKKYKTF